MQDQRMLSDAFTDWCTKKGWTREQLATHIKMSPDQLAVLELEPAPPTVPGGFSGSVQPMTLVTQILTRAAELNENVDTTRLNEVLKDL